AELLPQEQKPPGVCQAHGSEASHWEWRDRKYGTARDQSALERAKSLLVSRQRRGHTSVAVLLQSGSVGDVETYGHFSQRSTGSLTGKWEGARPSWIKAVSVANNPVLKG